MSGREEPGSDERLLEDQSDDLDDRDTNAPEEREEEAARVSGRARIGRAFTNAGAKMRGVRHKTMQKADAAKQMVKDKLHAADEAKAAGFGAVGAKLAEKRRAAQEALLEMSGPIRLKVMLALRENVKGAALADKDMPVCLKRKLAGGIDLLWDDIMVYVDNSIADVKEVVRGNRITDIEELGKLGADTAPTCCSPRWLRAFLLYKFLPYDLSIFGQAKDFWFWVFCTLSMIPTYGIRCIFFTFLLIAEVTGCPPDEYQLVQFILMFKGCQFLSSGVLMGIYVAVMYFLCVHPDGHHTCEQNGPAANTSATSAIVDIFGSCALVWIVFWILPRSTRSAGNRDIAKKDDGDSSDADEEEAPGIRHENSWDRKKMGPSDRGCCTCEYDDRRGGRIRGLLRYDLICFILSGLFFCTLCAVQVMHMKPGEKRLDPNHTQEQEKIKQGLRGYFNFSYEFRVAIYWTRIFYSALSAPFFLFYLPVLNGILTHTSPTGYNKYGRCVPFMMCPEEPPPDQGAPAEDLERRVSVGSKEVASNESREDPKEA